MRHWTRLVAWSLLLPLSSIGCAGYFPVRWPSRELWASRPPPTPAILWPSSDLADYPADTQQKNGVSVAVALIDPDRTSSLFHTDALRHRVQPLFVIIRNGSNNTYLFRKTDVDPHYIPAVRVAHMLDVAPLTTTTAYVKWILFIIPGLFFDTLIEPLSTLEFPGVHEAAQRPPRSNVQAIKTEVMNHEIGDEDIGPNGSLSGTMFLSPPKPGSVIPLRLLNKQTQQVLAFDISTPSAAYAERHDYPQPYDQVWAAALKAARDVPSWRVTSTDKNSGALTARVGLRMLLWSTKAQIAIRVQRASASHIQVEAQVFPPGSDHLGSSGGHRGVSRFFEQLNTLLPQPTTEQPRQPPTSSEPSGAHAASTTGAGEAQGPQTPSY